LFAYIEKAKISNQLLIDKEKLEKELANASVKNKEIMIKNEDNLRTLKIRHEIKFTNLKNKMSENFKKTKNKVTDLNLQYMDLSSRLSMLQNHQLLIQIEFLTQQIDELKEKIKSYEKQIYNLTKEIEIHKGVEISLAEKNKTLNLEVEKSKYTIQNNAGEKANNKTNTIFDSNKDSKIVLSVKNNDIKTECNEDDKAIDNIMYGKTISFNNYKNNNKSNFNNSNSVFNSVIFNSTNNTQQSKILQLERKVFDLGKKLFGAKKEYIDLKDRNEFTEKILQNYKNKYNGLFYFWKNV
jgi:hypothetical protein